MRMKLHYLRPWKVAGNCSMDSVHHYVYIVKCKDGTLYTGWTTDTEHRLKAHNSGQGAKYTKGRAPVQLVYQQQMENKSQALKRERAIKKLTREAKMKLITQFEQESKKNICN